MIRRFFSSSNLKTKKILYVKEFKGLPNSENFKLIEEELPALRDGDILTSAEYLSVDPYMRVYVARYKAPFTMIGGQVAKVIESKNSKFPVGSTIFSQNGWRTHKVFNPEEMQSKAFQDCYIIPKCDGHSNSLGLGVTGMVMVSMKLQFLLFY
jgi:prostaglandin reductase 1